jgi:threonine synthase
LIARRSCRIYRVPSRQNRPDPMRYISTRGQAPVRDFAGVLLAGLAEDGGLYVPESFPSLSPADLRALRGVPYPELAARVIHPFMGDCIPYDTLLRLARESYASFNSPAVVPLVQLGTDVWTQELFHGPTLAFKDMAMQLLGRLFDHVLTERDERVTIVGATSGDTGSAAIEACANRARVDIVILHPEGRTSEVQRRQMTTVHAPNLRNLAVAGTFDDCQDLVKAMFNDAPFRQEMRLSAVNSINWARILGQIPYYVAAAIALGAPDREIEFAVPTGNFGNVLAAYAARRMGVPIPRLIVASNRNDILARFLASNDMSVRGVEPSLSPSMDIQVSSNFERTYDRGRCRVARSHHPVHRLPARRRRNPRRHPRPVREFRLPRRPAQHHRNRGRPRLVPPGNPDGCHGNRPSRKIPRCDRGGNRYAPPSPCASGRPI